MHTLQISYRQRFLTSDSSHKPHHALLSIPIAAIVAALQADPARLTSDLFPDAEMWTFPMMQEGNGATGSLVKMDGCPSGGNGTLIYFSCSDCAVEAKRAADNGRTVVKEKFSITPG